MHLVDNDIAVAFEDFVLVKEEVDVETIQAVRQVPLTCSFSSKRSAEALFELAFPRRERRRGRPSAPARLGSSVYFPYSKHLFQTPPLSRTIPSKNCSGAVRALYPSFVFALVLNM